MKFRFTHAHIHTLMHSDQIFTGHTKITLAVKIAEVDHCFTVKHRCPNHIMQHLSLQSARRRLTQWECKKVSCQSQLSRVNTTPIDWLSMGMALLAPLNWDWQVTYLHSHCVSLLLADCKDKCSIRATMLHWNFH